MSAHTIPIGATAEHDAALRALKAWYRRFPRMRQQTHSCTVCPPEHWNIEPYWAAIGTQLQSRSIRLQIRGIVMNADGPGKKPRGSEKIPPRC